MSGSRVCEIAGRLKASLADWLNHLSFSVHTSSENHRANDECQQRDRIHCYWFVGADDGDTFDGHCQYLAAVRILVVDCRFYGSSADGGPLCLMLTGMNNDADLFLLVQNHEEHSTFFYPVCLKHRQTQV